MAKQTTDTTEMTDAVFDAMINDILPGAEPVTTKPNIFAPITEKGENILNTVTAPGVEEGGEKKPEPVVVKPVVTPEEEEAGAAILDGIINVEDEGGEDPNKGKSAPATAGGLSISTLYAKLVKDEILVPFNEDDEAKIATYTEKDMALLIKTNIEAAEKAAYEKAPAAFYDTLPKSLQYAFEYIEANGEQGLTELYRKLGGAQEVLELDIKNPIHQEKIVRQWLELTNIGTAEEIEEEIVGIKDRKELEKKANQFKPKLDAKNEEIITAQVEDAKARKEQRAANFSKYRDNVFQALEPGTINGIKLDKKKQEELFFGLTQANYPTSQGGHTNQLGFLLEKYQSVEPNPALIAEVLFLLSDKKGYDEAKKASLNTEIVTEVVRTLKTGQNARAAAGSPPAEGVEKKPTGTKTVQRPGSIFKRPAAAA